VKSDCSRISGLCVEPRGLRAMMEFARGVPIEQTASGAKVFVGVSPRRSDRMPSSFEVSKQLSGRVDGSGTERQLFRFTSLYSWSRCQTAQTIRASRLAKPTAATLWPRLFSRWSAQRRNESGFLARLA
jgi:hypothetical protein